MSDFKAKMHQIVYRLELRPRPRWGSLHRSPRLPSWILGGLLLREGREGDPLLSRYTPSHHILDKGLEPPADPAVYSASNYLTGWWHWPTGCEQLVQGCYVGVSHRESNLPTTSDIGLQKLGVKFILRRIFGSKPPIAFSLCVNCLVKTEEQFIVRFIICNTNISDGGREENHVCPMGVLRQA